jgi:hypothetical protein
MMSEYLHAEIHEDDEKVELRWLYNSQRYALVVGLELFDVLRVAEGQRSPVLLEVLAYDVDGFAFNEPA